MSVSRKELISQYNIQEPALMNLLNALCEKPEDANNVSIIKNALRGDYSDFGSRHAMPITMLAQHCKIAGYDDLVKKAEFGNFDHDYGPMPSTTHSNQDAPVANRAYQENSTFAFLKVLSENPDITMGELDKRVREDEGKGFNFK